MTASIKYAAVGVVGMALVVLALRPVLDPAAWKGVVVAAMIAAPVQVVAFAALNRYRDGLNGFLAAWVGGTMARMMVLAVVAFVVIRSGTDGAVALLLALAGFFFGLILLEPLFFRREQGQTG